MEENKNTSALRRRAQVILDAQEQLVKVREEETLNELKRLEKALQKWFERVFAEIIPELEEEGITYGMFPRWAGNAYECSSIHFYRNGLTGDFPFRCYDNVLLPSAEERDEFILWINQELLAKEAEPVPTPADLAHLYQDNYWQFFSESTEDAGVRSFFSLAWAILVDKEWSGKVCCLHPVGDLEGAQPIGVVCANLPGYTRTGVIFKEEYSYTECCDILNEINEQLFGPEIVPLQDAIVGSSMKADNVVQEDDSDIQNLTISESLEEQAKEHIHKWLRDAGAEKMHMLDEGEMDDVARILLNQFGPEAMLNISSQWIVLALQDVLAKRESKVN